MMHEKTARPLILASIKPIADVYQIERRSTNGSNLLARDYLSDVLMLLLHPKRSAQPVVVLHCPVQSSNRPISTVSDMRGKAPHRLRCFSSVVLQHDLTHRTLCLRHISLADVGAATVIIESDYTLCTAIPESVQYYRLIISGIAYTPAFVSMCIDT